MLECEMQYTSVPRFILGALATALVVTATSCSKTSPPLTAPNARWGPARSAEVARGTVQGRVGVLVYVDHARSHPIAKIPLTYDGVAALLDATGIDAVTEVDRAFVTAPSSEAK